MPAQLQMDFHAEPSFHDRDKLPTPEPERVRANAKASAQEAAILAWVKRRAEWASKNNESDRVTPWDVAAAFPGSVITSVRRALTNLTKREQLVHHPRDRRPGPYGPTSGTWGLP